MRLVFLSFLLVISQISLSCNDTPCYINWQKELKKKLSDKMLDNESRRVFSLQYNFTIEALNLFKNGRSDGLEELKRKYSILYDFKRDIIYHPLELEAVKKTYDTFGELYLGSQEVPLQWEAKMPWAGHWYPKNKKTLFEKFDAPLQKLERILKKTGFSTKMVTWEEENFSSGEAWEGLCTAWAIASIRTVEPVKEIHKNGEVLSIANQKALITKIHENFPFDVFGILYRGNTSTDGTYQDLRPEAFHKIMSVMLGQLGKPIIVDDDAGVEVWSKPVFKMVWQSFKDTQDEKVYNVSAKVYMVKHRQEETDKETSLWEDAVIHNYTYRLYVDPLINEGNTYKVIAGEWVGESWIDHPDVVIIPKDDAKPSSFNPEIDAHINEVINLLGVG